MKIAVFDAHRFELPFFDKANERHPHELAYFEPRLSEQTSSLARGFDVVCTFVNDCLDACVLQILKKAGIRLIALRSAGFNNVDLEAAARLQLPVVRVPEYSPYAVAEHTVCLMLALNRKVHRAFNRVREGNFSLDGLVGFDLHGKTVGVVGTGKIGSVLAKIMRGFGCGVLAVDVQVNAELVERYGVVYVDRDELYRRSDIISLHVPLTPETRHLIDEAALSKMKPGVMLINTGRGALIDTRALIQFLKSCQIGYAGLDVYEEEEKIFFQDLSGHVLQDDLLARLLTFPNVLITSHQAFLTREALTRIAETTLESVSAFEKGLPLQNEVHADRHIRPSTRVSPQRRAAG